MLRKCTSILIACLAFLAATHLHARSAEGKAQIFVGPHGDDLIVTIALDRKVTTLDLQKADVARIPTARFLSPDFRLSEEAITSDLPFDRVSFLLVEDLTERDAKYPPYYRIGSGRMLYAPTILPEPDKWSAALTVVGTPPDWRRWPETPLPQGYLYIGPEANLVSQGGGMFVFDGNATPELEHRIIQTVSESLAFLADVFDSPPASTPFVATRILPSEHRFSTGDVSPSAMVTLRFYGEVPDPSKPDALATTRAIILHEGVHFWNGGVANFSDGSPQWLHEGGAEYIANLGSLALGWSNPADFRKTVGTWLDRCRTSLSYSDEAALDDLEFLNASLRYSCGPLIQFLGDLYLADACSSRTMTEAWRETVRQAVSDDGEYGLGDFVAASGHPDLLSRPAIDAILKTPGEARWAGVIDEMRRMGVVVEEQSSPPLRARTALMHMIRMQCTELQPGEGYGFYSGETSYRLDTPAGCGLLAGGPVVESLAGSPLTALEATDYERLQQLCASNAAIDFGLVDGTAIAVPCSQPLPPAATSPVLMDLPPIRAFAPRT